MAALQHQPDLSKYLYYAIDMTGYRGLGVTEAVMDFLRRSAAVADLRHGDGGFESHLLWHLVGLRLAHQVILLIFFQRPKRI